MRETGSPIVERLSLGIDRSSWVSWGCFVLGVEIARGPALNAEIRTLGPGVLLVIAAILLFFILIIPIQRHMRLSLLATSYGQPREMVTSGCFRYSRNPIYVCFLLPLAAIAYFSPLAAGIAVAAYLVTMTAYVIKREERDLEAEFGDAYRAYKARTPRWMLFF